jgi:hypothetical protein
MTLALDREIVYPESDGQPMADNTEQFKWIVLLIAVFLRMRNSPSATLRARGLSVAEARISPICKPL